MVYLDNASTTQPFPEVVEIMNQASYEIYGNPSSTHSIGRKARAKIEQARKDIAKHIGASGSEIIFTSGGTEANNIFLQGVAGQVKHIISSPLEHPAVLNTLKNLEQRNSLKISWLKVSKTGDFNFEEIRDLINTNSGSLVVLMNGNNEIGNLIDINSIAKLCENHKSMFFSDTVQTIGHYNINVKELGLTALSASAHKFHGPKGVGFLYLKKGTNLHHIYSGGAQERGLRSGTENVAAIMGMAKALDLCYKDLETSQEETYELKSYLMESIQSFIPDVEFNGTINDRNSTMNSIVSVSLPPHEENEMLQFNLDLVGVAVSAGSACASGAVKDSHVMEAIGHDSERAVIRFSLSRQSTKKDIDFALSKINNIYRKT